MTAYYFASQHSNASLLRDYRDQTIATIPQATVVSTWHDLHACNSDGDTPLDASVLQHNVAHGEAIAKRDLDDLAHADVFVAINTGGKATGTGAGYVEFGVALDRGYRLDVIGGRDNVFYCHPNVRIYRDFDEWLLVQADVEWVLAFGGAGINTVDGGTPRLDSIKSCAGPPMPFQMLTFSLPDGLDRETVRRSLDRLHDTARLNVELCLSANPDLLVLACAPADVATHLDKRRGSSCPGRYKQTSRRRKS